MKNKLIVLLLLTSSLFGQQPVLDLDFRQGSLLSKGTANVTVTNNNTTFTQTEKGLATSYNSTSSYLSIPDNDALDFGTGSFSIEVWFNISAGISSTKWIISKGAGGGTLGYSISLTSSNITTRIEDATGQIVSTTYSIKPNTWYHYIVVFNRNALTVIPYLNAVPASSVAIRALTINTAYALAIGSYTSGSDKYKGSISRTRIYNYALTQSQINQNYQEFVTSSYSPRSIYPMPTMSDILENKDIYIDERFDYGASGIAGRIPNWVAGTGSYKISEATSDDAVVKTIKKGTKYLQCTSSNATNTIALPSVAWAGQIEFDVYKGDNANTIYCQFINSNTQDRTLSSGYTFLLASDESIQLRKYTAGVLGQLNSSNASYVANNTWYHITIDKRIGTDSIYIYVQGGAYPTKTKVAQSGSYKNPVYDATFKTSRYFVLDLDSGDRFANLKITNANYLTKGFYDYLDQSSMIKSGSNIMMWGDKSGGGNAGVLGNELVTNGSFDTDVSWSKGTGWSINLTTKKADCDGSQISGSNLTQPVASFATNKVYKVTYTISNYSAGSVRLYVGGNGVGGVSRSANNTYTETHFAGSAAITTLYIQADADFIGSIDDVSVKEINPNGNNLAQGTSAYMPLLESDGILFDGTSDYLKTAAFTLNQPTSVYAVLKQVTWSDYDRFWDGNTNARNFVNQRNVTPSLGFYGGTSYATGYYSRLTLNTFGILRAIFNGTSSNIRLNNRDILNTSTGTNSFDGFTLGAQADGAANQSNIKVKGIALIQGVLDPIRDEILRNGLKYKYGVIY